MAVQRRFRFQLQHPAAIIFGAGATHGAFLQSPVPPPIDADFFSVANRLRGHGTPALAKRVLRSLWELYGHVEGIGLEEYYRELETRAVIARVAKSVGKPKDWAKRRRDLEELIRRVYVQTTTSESTGTRRPLRSPAHQAVLDGLPDGSTIITFNYDLLIEESFRTADRWNPRDGYGLEIPGITHDWARGWLRDRGVAVKRKSKVLLLKLHGSLGWASYKNRSIKLKARPYYVRRGMNESISVLPPGWNKKIHVNPYRKLWGQARLRLQKCSSLLIVGYSLPETDLLARALFSEIVRVRAANESYISQLILADPKADVRAKFVTLLTPALGPVAKVTHLETLEDLVSAA